jgi:uncharacterized membrane protein
MVAKQTKPVRKAAGTATKTAAGTAKTAASAANTAATTATKTAAQAAGGPLGQSMQRLVQIAAQRLVTGLSDTVASTTGRLTDYAAGGAVRAASGAVEKKTAKKAGKALPAAVLKAGLSTVGHQVKHTVGGLTAGLGGGDGGGQDSDRFKVTSIIEQVDIGAPIELVYDQWTRFTDFPAMMKKVENVEQLSDEKLRWTARILWSHRTWESTILEQVPDERIVWTSEGDKGSVDGAVTFHELAPDLTRVVVVLAYHPKGLFERTGNLWRAQGRRARLELKNFQRHVMTETVLHADEVEGWRSEIHDGEVVTDQREPEDEPEDERDSGDEEEPESAPSRAPASRRRGAGSTRNNAVRERKSRA